MNLLKTSNRLALVALVVSLLPCFGTKAFAQVFGLLDSVTTPLVCDSPFVANIVVHGSKCSTLPTTIAVDWSDNSTISQYSFSYFFGCTIGSCYGCNFDVPFSHTYSFPGVYSAIAYVYIGLDTFDTIHFSIEQTTQCATISGRAYYDLDSNCVYGGVDLPTVNRTISVSSGATVIGTAVTDMFGQYQIHVEENQSNLTIAPSGIYNWLWEANCVNSNTYTTHSFSDNTKDYPSKLVNHFDRVINVSAFVSPPGSNGYVSLTAYHVGFYPDTSSVYVVLDTAVTYSGIISGQAPSSVNGDTLFFDYYFNNSFTYFLKYVHSIIRLTTDTNATIGQDVHFFSHIDSNQNEVNQSNNSCEFNDTVNASYDPNNKVVSPQGKGESGRIDQGTELTYTVNFQNTGTAPAKNVFIFDTIQQNLDMSTFQLIGSSHDMTPYFFDGKIIRFDFPNINLPDSNANEPESHGWVMYSIKADSGFDIGSSHEVKNTAYIYFDYNAPIITNTTLNTIYVKIPLEAEVSTTNMLCTATNNGTAEVSVMAGEPPYSIIWNTGDTAYAIDQLGTGLYTVTVTDNEDQVLVISDSVAYVPTFTEPIAGEVNGPLMAASWVIYNYTIDQEPGSSYTWEAEGGEVIATANNTASILWYGGPKGVLRVWETSEHGCTSIDPTVTEVDVNFLSVEERDNLSISIYPNPASQQFSVINPTGQECNLNIFDAQGRLVKSVAISGNRTEVSLTEIAPGSYTLSLSGMDFSQHIRVMVY